MFWNEVLCCYCVGKVEKIECFDMAVLVFGVV